MSATGELTLDFPACLAADFPREMAAADRAVDRVLGALPGGASFDTLEERSPGLRGNDWSNYLRCSEARMVHAAGLLRRTGVVGGRVLDYGAYFGNFSLLFQELGYQVDAVDAYGAYGEALRPMVELLRDAGVRTRDFADTGRDLQHLPAGSYDVVLCMSVIEHVPHTPRTLLEPLSRVVRPGGLLVIDTPNLAQLPNRQKLARGEAVMTPLPIQYHATVPFEGHHREYTIGEVAWMVQELGHELVAVDLFNYSAYGQAVLTGRDVTNHWRTVATPDMREMLLVVSRKPEPGAPVRRVEDWRAVLEDQEQYWQARLPEGFTAEEGEGLVATELLVSELRDAVTTRDRMLAEAEAERVREVTARDATISDLNERLGALQFAFDMTPSERLKRLWRRLSGRGR